MSTQACLLTVCAAECTGQKGRNEPLLAVCAAGRLKRVVRYPVTAADSNRPGGEDERRSTAAN